MSEVIQSRWQINYLIKSECAHTHTHTKLHGALHWGGVRERAHTAHRLEIVFKARLGHKERNLHTPSTPTLFPSSLELRVC